MTDETNQYIDERLQDYFAVVRQQEADHAEWVKANNREFIQKWPNYCKACDGWGGKTYYESHGSPYGHETLFDFCGELDEHTCHRCGQAGLKDDSEGPCKFCGWNFDDGLAGAC